MCIDPVVETCFKFEESLKSCKLNFRLGAGFGVTLKIRAPEAHQKPVGHTLEARFAHTFF